MFLHVIKINIFEVTPRWRCYLYLLISNFKLTLSSISNSLPFWSINFMKIFSNSIIYVFSNTKLLGLISNKYALNLLGIIVHNTSDFYWYWLWAKLHWTKTTPTISRLGNFSPFFVLCINFFVLSNNFIVPGFVIVAYIHLLL